MFCYQYKLNSGAGTVWDLGGLVISSDNPLDLHDEIVLVEGVTSKYLYVGWKLNNFEYHHLQNDFYLEIRLNQMFLIFLTDFQQVNVLFYVK